MTYLDKYLSWLLAVAAIFTGALVALAQETSEPVVARVQMQLILGDKITETIKKGDLLTSIGEKDDTHIVLTLNGARGRVAKVNAVKLAESVEIYNELIAANSKDGRIYTLRAAAWSARGDKKKAIEDFDRAIELGYREGHAYTSRGMFQAATGNYDAAVGDFTEALKLSPKEEASYLNRAAVYMAQGKFDAAIRDYDVAVKINNASPRIYEQRAVAYRSKQDFTAAASDFSKAIELDPKSVAAWMGRGFVSYLQSKHRDAILDFTTAIELSPKHAMAYNNRGYNWQLLGEFKKAMEDFDRCLAIDPGYGQCCQNKAWLLATAPDDSLRDGKEAIRLAMKACDASQYKDSQDLQTLAAAFAEDKQFGRAIGWQEKVVGVLSGEDKKEAQKVLDIFKSEKPYREPPQPNNP